MKGLLQRLEEILGFASEFDHPVKECWDVEFLGMDGKWHHYSSMLDD